MTDVLAKLRDLWAENKQQAAKLKRLEAACLRNNGDGSVTCKVCGYVAWQGQEQHSPKCALADQPEGVKDGLD